MLDPLEFVETSMLEDNETLKLHKEVKHLGDIYQCGHCAYTTKHAQALKKHYKAKHKTLRVTKRKDYALLDSYGDDPDYPLEDNETLKLHKEVNAKHKPLRVTERKDYALLDSFGTDNPPKLIELYA